MVGLLITVMGKVTEVEPGYFTVDDHTKGTVRVSSAGLSSPSVGNWVTVTGISSAVTEGGTYRLMLSRRQSDVIIYTP